MDAGEAALRASQLYVLAGHRHLATRTAPEAVARETLRFLDADAAADAAPAFSIGRAAMSAFQDLAAIPAQQLSPGYLARAVHGSRVTFAVVEIEPHAELPEHSHENEQLGIVLRGSVIFRVGSEERTLEAGGTWSVSSHAPHFVKGGPDGAIVLDVFAPTREEWKHLAAMAAARPNWP